MGGSGTGTARGRGALSQTRHSPERTLMGKNVRVEDLVTSPVPSHARKASVVHHQT